MAESNRSVYTDSGRIGFIYVLGSKALKSNGDIPMLKIGATRKHPLTRAKELGISTGVPIPYELLYFRDFSDSFVAESLIHEHFASHRVNNEREFFYVSLNEAMSFIDGLCNSITYRDLASQNVTGGTYVKPVKLPDLSFAELFATFDPNGPLELKSEERAQCRALERRRQSYV